MKKLISLLLALVMVLSLSATAFADIADTPTVTVKVKYKATNEGTTSPAETFAFSIAPFECKDVADGITKGNMPAADQFTLTMEAFDAGDATYAAPDVTNPSYTTKNLTITLPSVDKFPSRGVYSYDITPTSGSNAGVKYYSNTIRLVITVINGEDGNKLRYAAIHTETGYEGTHDDGTKKDDILEEYKAGKLTVKKFAIGNLADKGETFTVNVTLTPVTGKNYQEITYAGYQNGTIPVDGQSYPVAVKDQATITFTNIPYGVEWTVEEAAGTGYNTAYYLNPTIPQAEKDWETLTATTTTTGTIGDANHDDTFVIVNSKGVTVDTGVVLDNAPYIVLLVVAVIGLAIVIIKKRQAREY